MSSRLEMAAPEFLSLVEVDRLVARYVWLERRRFEVLGTWVTSTPELDVAQLLATQSHHHAWHASLWERHLPRRSGHVALAAPTAGPELRAFVKAVAQPVATLPRMVGAFRVLGAATAADYADQLVRASTVSGGAFARSCRLVLDDQRDDLADAESTLRALLDTDEVVELAERHQAELAALLLAAGGIAGP